MVRIASVGNWLLSFPWQLSVLVNTCTCLWCAWVHKPKLIQTEVIIFYALHIGYHGNPFVLNANSWELGPNKSCKLTIHETTSHNMIGIISSIDCLVCLEPDNKLQEHWSQAHTNKLCLLVWLLSAIICVCLYCNCSKIGTYFQTSLRSLSPPVEPYTSNFIICI